MWESRAESEYSLLPRESKDDADRDVPGKSREGYPYDFLLEYLAGMYASVEYVAQLETT